MARIEVWDTDKNSPTYGEKVERFSVDVKEQEKLGLVSRTEPAPEEQPETAASIEKKSQPKSKPPVAKE